MHVLQSPKTEPSLCMEVCSPWGCSVFPSNQPISAYSPAPLGMLKLRRPIFSDEIDLDATFDIETPPARSSDIHFGLAKKLCLEKAS